MQEMRVDEEGFIHLTSGDLAALQNKVIGAVTQFGALIEHFGQEQASLQDIYRRTMGKDK